jgi:hypothetical protein
MSRAYRKAPQVTAHSEEQAERWLADGLKAAGLMAKDLPALKGSDPRKLALAELPSEMQAFIGDAWKTEI